VEEAQREILGRVRVLPSERVDVLAALGRVLAEPIRSTRRIPPWPNSSMDGYAVRAADARPPATLRVVGRVVAGSLPTRAVGVGEAVRIFTGAPLPSGADAVIPQEDVDARDGVIALRNAVEPAPMGRRRGGAEADVLVSSAGVSVGELDLVREALVNAGAELHLWKVDMRPGKPITFGSLGGKPVFGLPGNPVSAMVTFELFVRPMLLAMQGRRGTGRLTVRATALAPIVNRGSRRGYLRVVPALALAAFVATGCASRGDVRRMQDDVAALRASVTDLRHAHELSTRELVRVAGELRALDARNAELQAALGEHAAETARLRA